MSFSTPEAPADAAAVGVAIPRTRATPGPSSVPGSTRLCTDLEPWSTPCRTTLTVAFYLGDESGGIRQKWRSASCG